MIQRGSLATIACLLLALGSSTTLWGQNAEELLREGHELYQRGRYEEGLQKMKSVLALDPSSEEAFQLVNALEPRVWANIMIKGGEHEAMVKALMDSALPGERSHQRDPARIRELTKTLEQGTWPERTKAITTLLADHGEYGAAHLTQHLNSSDTMRRATTMNWLRRMGTESIHPLIQCLESSDPLTRSGAATVLGQLGARQAVPYLGILAGSDSETMVREQASRALSDMGASASGGAGGLIELASGYYRGDKRVVDPYRRNTTVWSWEEDNLVGRDVPGDVYGLKLAEEALYDSLAMEPGSPRAESLLASVLLAQANAAAGTGEADNPLLLARDLAAAMGPKTLNAALRQALAENRPDVATEAINLLAGMPGAAHMDGIVQALSSDNKSVRIAAALAGSHSKELASQVVPVLAEGVGQDSVRSVLVVDDQPSSRAQIVSDLNARGYFTDGALSGPQGFARLRQYPIEDAIIIRYNLQDATVAEIIRLVRKDEKTTDMPIAILADAGDMEMAKEQYGDRVQLFIESPAVVEAYEPQLRSLVTEVEGSRDAAAKLAADCAHRLAHMDSSLLRGVADALKSALAGVDDRIRVPAVMALGASGDSSASDLIGGILGDGSQSDALRGAAAVALAKLANAGGTASNSVVSMIQDTLKGGGSSELMQHLSKAAGLLPVDGGTRFDLLKELRSRITIGSTGDGD